MVKVTPSVKASTFEASCELFTVARVARRRLRNGFLWYHIWKHHDRTRRSDTVAVTGDQGAVVTIPDDDRCRFVHELFQNGWLGWKSARGGSLI